MSSLNDIPSLSRSRFTDGLMKHRKAARWVDFLSRFPSDVPNRSAIHRFPPSAMPALYEIRELLNVWCWTWKKIRTREYRGGTLEGILMLALGEIGREEQWWGQRSWGQGRSVMCTSNTIHAVCIVPWPQDRSYTLIRITIACQWRAIRALKLIWRNPEKLKSVRANWYQADTLKMEMKHKEWKPNGKISARVYLEANGSGRTPADVGC